MKERNKKIIGLKLIIIFIISLISFDFRVEGQQVSKVLHLKVTDNGCEFATADKSGLSLVDSVLTPGLDTGVDLFKSGGDIGDFSKLSSATDKSKIYNLISSHCNNIDPNQLDKMFNSVDEKSFIGSDSVVKFDKNGKLSNINNLKLTKGNLDGSFFGMDQKTPFSIGKDSTIKSFGPLGKGNNLALDKGSFKLGDNFINVKDMSADISSNGKLSSLDFTPTDKEFNILKSPTKISEGSGKFSYQFLEDNKMNIDVRNVGQGSLKIDKLDSFDNIEIKNGNFIVRNYNGNKYFGGYGDILYHDTFTDGVNLKINEFSPGLIQNNWYQDSNGFIRFGEGEKTISLNGKDVLINVKDPKTIFLGQKIPGGIPTNEPSMLYDETGRLVTTNLKDVSFSSPIKNEPLIPGRDQTTFFKIDANGHFAPNRAAPESPINEVSVNGKVFDRAAGGNWYDPPSNNVNGPINVPKLPAGVSPGRALGPSSGGSSLSSFLLIGGIVGAIALVLAYNGKSSSSDKNSNSGSNSGSSYYGYGGKSSSNSNNPGSSNSPSGTGTQKSGSY